MDSYREVASFNLIGHCETACDVLESAKIPVIIQHSLETSNLKLLVASRCIEKAISLLSTLGLFRSLEKGSVLLSHQSM